MPSSISDIETKHAFTEQSDVDILIVVQRYGLCYSIFCPEIVTNDIDTDKKRQRHNFETLYDTR